MMKKGIVNQMIMIGLSPFLVGCATTPTVNTHALDARKNQTFSIGMVKVEGQRPMFDNLDRKKQALEKIPVTNICHILSKKFGLKTNLDVDRTVKVVKECGILDGGNPYWGVKHYEYPSFLKGFASGNNSECIKDEDTGNMIYITYRLDETNPLHAFTDSYSYEILVKSDADILLRFRGLVARVPTPKKGLSLDMDGSWKNFVSYADNIAQVFEEDVDKAKTTTSEALPK
jgi:hypothetical protein